MKMKIHIAAGILAAAILADGCGKIVRDELITMQNEIDLLYAQVEQANKGLKTLQDIVRAMAANGYITDVEEIQAEGERGGYILRFRIVTIDENGVVSSEENFSINLYSGVDGKDGQDALPYVVSAKRHEDGRWYWYSTQDEDWITDDEGNRLSVDGRTPQLRIEDGFWSISWDGKELDDPEKNWEKTEWKAKGEDAYEWFSNAVSFADRVELTLTTDGSVLVLPRLLPVDVSLTRNGEPLEDENKVLIAPGEKISVQYALSGTGAENAVLVAGTDGRMKTALRAETATEGAVDITCPEQFPVGGYVYITVNDGNGRSIVRVIHFDCRILKLINGEAEAAPTAEGETRTLTFEPNFDVEVSCVFPKGVEPWLTTKAITENGYLVLTYDVAANTTTEKRTGMIVVSPKDNPDFEMFRVTVVQEGKHEGEGSGTGTGE